jgi:predicted NodU family carbamoyl transferase
MNGRIRKESGFREVYVPSAPGDEGIALGCALYGLQVSIISVSKLSAKFTADYA